MKWGNRHKQVVSDVVLDKINQHVFDRHQLAYICVDHSSKIIEYSENIHSYGFDNVSVGTDVTDVVDFMVGADTRHSLELPMMATPSGTTVTVNMLADDECMTILMLDASTQMQYRSKLQQAANENELLVDQQQKLMRKLEVASDELQQKNLQLQEANRLQTSFLSGVSHEFRTPLTSIIGYTDLVKKNLSASEAQKNSSENYNVDHLRAANRSSKHLLSLVENLLDHGKLNSNEIVVRPKPIDLVEVFHDVKMLIMPLCDTKGIELFFHSDFQSPVWVLIDDSRLRQCLINLIGNAVKFTDRGCVTVSASWQSDVLEVSIVDTGLGIEPQDLEKIRLPFWQAEGTGKAGTGLGLTITERIIELMGGELQINSVVGEGTSVDFSLSAPEMNRVETEQTVSIGRTDFNILLAEDDADIANLVLMLLAENGVTVSHAKNGEIAVKMMQENQYDLVLMDLNMPVMNGYQAIKKIRERDTATPVVVMSASALEDQRHPVAAIECDAYLVKPVDVADILKIANDLIK